MLPVFDHLNLRDADSVIGALELGTSANFGAPCRVGSVDRIGPYAASGADAVSGAMPKLIATGDLHDNPLHLARLVQAANLADPAPLPAAAGARHHLTLHELIHSDNIVNHTDFSYRVLVRAAALKAAFPERVHVLLANHELAQLTGAEVVKEGVRCVAAFDEGVNVSFHERAEEVREAIKRFIRSMPLGLMVYLPRSAGSAAGRGLAARGRQDECDHDVVLCAHSVPSPHLWGTFDAEILRRELVDDDYLPRTGACHQMTWGRGLSPENVAEVHETLKVNGLILGHEKAENGYIDLGERSIILNSDHERGAYLELDMNVVWPDSGLSRFARRLDG